MSGTSLDGIDGALVRWSAGQASTLAFDSAAYPPELRADMMRLQAPGENELHRAALAAVGLADAYAELANRLLRQLPVGSRLSAIGAHGQTVRHRPDAHYTVQLLDGARLAELTGCAVVCDFRSADIAAGGQGAPLVPAFHAQVFGDRHERRAIVNLGGIANVSLLGTHGEVDGFDTGPANVLLDLWAAQTLGEPLDKDGRLAAAGRVVPSLLAQLLTEPYFGRAAPKSTGRDLFNADWLAGHLAVHRARHGSNRAIAEPSAADIQATLAELTAETVARACVAFGAQAVYLCGGGAFNPVLLSRIRALCAPAQVATTDALGAAAQAVEAVAFAWLARCRLTGTPGNHPAVTGARGLRVLGAIYAP